MLLEFLIKAGLLLCLPFLSLQESYTPHEIVFNYNNTYKYNVSYEVAVDRNTEYIMEFAGDQVLYDTPARVTVASNFANKTYPLFITARQQKGVFSWQLPVVVASSSGSIHQFSNISRTLCPHNNMFAQGEDSCDTPVTNTPIIHLTSSSPDPIKVTIKVETVQDFYIKLDRMTNVSSAPSQPQYYFYPFDQGAASGLVAQGVRRKQLCREQLDDQEQTILDRYYEMANLYKTTGWLSRPKSVILLIESDDDLCAVVSIQNFSCPVFDNERDILYDGYYLTMTRRGGITLTQDTFPIGFYIVFIVKTSDADCTGQAGPGGANETTSILHYFRWEQARDTVAVNTNDGRVKTFSFRVISTISYQEYLVGAGAALAFFLAFYVAFLVALCVQTRRRTRDRLTEEGTSSPPTALAPDVVTNALRRRTRDTSADHGDATTASLSSPSDTESSSSEAEEVQDRDWHRLSGKLCLANLSRCRSRVLQARSRLYLWNVLTVAVFYTLPVVQLVVTYQRLLNQSGNQDLCYFNFLCAHPLLVVSDFNHVYSNLGYILLGFLFLARVRRRHKEHQEKTEQEKQLGIPQHFGLLYAMGVALVSEGLLSAAYHVCPNSMNFQFVRQKQLGIPQHFGLLYAMGVALVSEGLLSAAYHVCPNSMNFQFDTSFMYVTSVLCMVKIYQARHPDINARAHATFGVLALIIFIGLVGVLNANLYFWVAFTALHLVTCQVLTFQIYYLGRFKIDGGTLYRACIMLSRGGRAALTPTHIGRGAMLLAANLANWALAVYGVTQHSRDFASHLLLVLMSNLFLYTLFYIIMKLLHRESIRWISWVYIALTYTVWFSSSYFYLDQSTNWALTPAQSRRHNRVCSLLQLYDSHDVWHFASATAMFFSFNMYLTIDDNLATVSRNDIMVF